MTYLSRLFCCRRSWHVVVDTFRCCFCCCCCFREFPFFFVCYIFLKRKKRRLACDAPGFTSWGESALAGVEFFRSALVLVYCGEAAASAAASALAAAAMRAGVARFETRGVDITQQKKVTQKRRRRSFWNHTHTNKEVQTLQSLTSERNTKRNTKSQGTQVQRMTDESSYKDKILQVKVYKW